MRPPIRHATVFVVAFLLIAATALSPNLMAADLTWTGTGGNNLASNAGNWNPVQSPAAADNCLINTGAVAISWDLLAASAVNSLTLDTGYTGIVTLAQSFTATSYITVNAGTLQTAKSAAVLTPTPCNITTTGTFSIGASGTVIVRRSSIAADGAGQTINCAALTVAGMLHADGEGFDLQLGPGGTGPTAAMGASHGGVGMWGTKATYGSFTDPTALGSSGRDGYGGGAIKIVATGTVTVSGTVSATSLPKAGAVYYMGAGGSINITAAVLAGAGVIRANGSVGNQAGSNRPGGGGRITVRNVASLTFTGTLQANGGDYSANSRAFAGTLCFPPNYNLTLSAAGMTTLRLGADGTNNYSFGDVVVDSGGKLELDGNPLLVPYGGAATLNVQSLDVRTGGVVSADGLGFIANTSTAPGFGSYPLNGVHGGASGRNPNQAYGSFTDPREFGGPGRDAHGGGAVIVVAVAGVTVNGTVTANGAAPPDTATSTANYCAGAGGSINITAATLAGTGIIQANGLPMDTGGGDGPCGGRVAFNISTTDTYSGTIQVNGHLGNYYRGTTGTICLSAQKRANLVLGGAGNMATLRLGSDGASDYTFGTITINSGGILEIDGNPFMNMKATFNPDGVTKANGGAATINVGTLTVNTGGILRADALGSSTGPGCNLDGNFMGTYGGQGGTMNAATTNVAVPYGSVTDPRYLGSSRYPNYPGGGAIIVNCSGTVTVNGTGVISAVGAINAGGSGGSINIHAASVAGNGTVRANGGAGWWGGGGGRVAVILSSGTDFASLVIQARGGNNGTASGAAGTVYLQHAGNPANGGELIIENGGVNPTNCNPKTVISSSVIDTTVGKITVNNRGWVQIDTGQTLTGSGDLSFSNLSTLNNNGTLNVSGALTINAGTTLTNGTTSAGTLNVAGNWTNAGTFTDTSGSVNLTGGSQTINNSNTFFNLNKTAGATATLTVQAGTTQTVSNNVTLRGANATTLLSLRSSTPATQWTLTPNVLAAKRDVAYLDVQDTRNSNLPFMLPARSADSGNTFQWFTRPTAANDSYSVNEDNTLTVTAPGVLTNDTDAETITAVLSAGPTHGALTLNADGSFTYTPVANYNGPDSFTYRADDGCLYSAVATVSITVNPVNDAPVANADNYSVNEDVVLTVAAPGVLGNDTDIEGDPLTAVLGVGPTHGALTLNADGSFTYTPVANYNGPDSFTYKASDGAAQSALATVSITVNSVNDAPVATNDAYSVNEDAVLTVAAPGVLGNDTDVDSDPLTAVLGVGPTHGALTLNADGSFTYTPVANYNGPDSFTYKASDGTAQSALATVSITVNTVNDAPVATDDSYSVNEDAVLTVAAPGVLGNDTDLDGDPLTAVLGVGPTHGALTLNADGSFTYTPAADYHGPDSFTYRADDGTAQSALATVSITVNSVNDAPVATNDAYSVSEDAVLTVAAPGVLGNDTDADGDPLTALLGVGPTHGVLTLNADGSFTYTPTANYNGPDSFTYKASDGTAQSALATVSITVNSVNDAPVAAIDTYSTKEDTPLNVAAPGILGNDSDLDGDPLTAVLGAGPAHGTLTLNANGSFAYTPAHNYFGPDSFTYHATDGVAQSALATVTITVSEANVAPVAVDDAYALSGTLTLTVPATGVITNDSDADGDALTATLVSGATQGVVTLNADGSFTYTLFQAYSGTDTFSYQVSDGRLTSNIATVTLTITAQGGGATPGDTDGDGFTDVEEGAAATSPTDPAQHPSRMGVAFMKGTVRFLTAGADAWLMETTLPGAPATYPAAGTTVKLNCGGAELEFVLNAKGRAKSPYGTLRYLPKGKTGLPTLQVRVTSGSWASAWADEGLNPTVTTKGLLLTFIIVVDIGGSPYVATAIAQTTIEAGKGARFTRQKTR